MWPIWNLIYIFLVDWIFCLNINRFKERLQLLSSQTFLRMTQISLANTSWPKPQTTYEKILIVWMIFGSKLLSSFLMLVIYSFLKYLHYRQTQTSSGEVENLQLRFGSPLRDPFLALIHPLWVLIHTLETTRLDQLTNRCVKLQQQVGLFLNLLQIADSGQKSIVASFSQTAQPFSHFS